MNKKALLSGGIFAFFGCLLFLGSMAVNRTYFERLAYDSVFSYQFRQLLAVIVLYGLGFLFLLLIRDTLSPGWTALFAFPAGIFLWVIPSLLLLLLGIPYTFPLTMTLIAALLGGLYVHMRFRRRRRGLPAAAMQALPHLLLFLGFAFLVATGFTYSFVSYDSYFYFINYGNTLTIVRNFQDIVGTNSFTLTNISQFLPLLHSYTAFWGLDQGFQVQAFLMYNIAACFFYGLYRYLLRQSVQQKRALLLSALFTLLLVSCTSFIIISSWVLANMYCMAYIFLLVLASFLVSHLDGSRRDSLLLIGMCFISLTLLRKDGIIFAAFFLICFACVELFPRRQLVLVFLPAVLAEVWWMFYVRVILDPGVTQAVFSSIANNKNIFFVALIIIGSYLYLFVGHPLMQWLVKKFPKLTEYYILLFGMFLLFVYSFVKKQDVIIDNVDFVIRNMFRQPSSWGISGFIFAGLLALSLVRKFELDHLHFLWSGYAFLNLISYCIVDSKWFWLNWDDSYNRVLLQIVPVFVFVTAVKSLALLQSDTPDHSCVSLTGDAQ